MVIWTAPGETWDFVCEAERDLPAEEQTIFRLKSLDADAGAHIQNEGIGATTDPKAAEGDGVGEVEMRMRTGTVLLTTLRLGLDDVLGLRDKAGQPVPMPKESRRIARRARLVPTLKFLDGLPSEVRDEVATEISNRNTFTETDAKNS